MAAVHFEFECFQNVHVGRRRRQRLGAAGAVLVRAHDDGGPAAGLRRWRREEEPRQLAPLALAELLLPLGV